MPQSIPISVTAEQLAAVTYNADGLVPAIVQEEGTGQVLMMAWMNEDSLRQTMETGRTWFWSRARQETHCSLWLNKRARVPAIRATTHASSPHSVTVTDLGRFAVAR